MKKKRRKYEKYQIFVLRGMSMFVYAEELDFINFFIEISSNMK